MLKDKTVGRFGKPNKTGGFSPLWFRWFCVILKEYKNKLKTLNNETTFAEYADNLFDALAFNAGWVTFDPELCPDHLERKSTPLFQQLLKLEVLVTPELATFFKVRSESEGLSW